MKLLIAAFLFFGISTYSFAQNEHHKSSGATQVEEQKVIKKQVNCPVLGNPINKTVYTDYKGKRVYFCCSGCIDAFKKAPDKYMKKMKDEGIELDNSPLKK